MKKIDYEKLSIFLISGMILFICYSVFNYLIYNLKNMNKDNQEFTYISQINRDFVSDKTVIPPIENFFNRELNITETKMTLTYKLKTSDDCSDFVEGLHNRYNVWTNVHVKTPVYSKDIPQEQLRTSYDLICQDELVITFIIDKESEYFIQRQKEQLEYEEKRKLEQLVYDNNTKELEHILLNLRNYYEKGSYLNSPYNFFNSEITHNEDNKTLTLTYFDVNENLCSRSMQIFKYNKSDEFNNQTIIYFDERTTNLIINDIDLNKLDQYNISYICKEKNKISYIFDKQAYIKIKQSN